MLIHLGQFVMTALANIASAFIWKLQIGYFPSSYNFVSHPCVSSSWKIQLKKKRKALNTFWALLSIATVCFFAGGSLFHTLKNSDLDQVLTLNWPVATNQIKKTQQNFNNLHQRTNVFCPFEISVAGEEITINTGVEWFCQDLHFFLRLINASGDIWHVNSLVATELDCY